MIQSKYLYKKGEQIMKKILSILLAAAMILSLTAILGSCSFNLKPKTPSEKFREAYEKIAEELRVGPLDKQYEVKDANDIDATLTVKAPALIGDDAVTVVIRGGFDRDREIGSADITLKYKSSEIRANAEVTDGDVIIASFPGSSDDYLCLPIEKAGDLLDEDFGKLVKEIRSYIGKIGGTNETTEKLREKYETDERVSVEETDAEILGEKVSGVEKLSVTLERDDIVDIMKTISEPLQLLGGDKTIVEEFDEDSLDENAKVTVNLYTKDGHTVRAELLLTNSGSEDDSLVYELAVKGGDVKAALTFNQEKDGEKTVVPIVYEHKNDNGKIEGSIAVDADNAAFPGTEIDKDQLGALKVEFSGEESANSAEMTYKFKIGAGGATVVIPLEIRTEKKGGGVGFSAKIDSKLVGVSIKAEGTVTKSGYSPSGKSASGGIEISKDMSEADQQKIATIIQGVTSNASDFVSLIQGVMGGVGGFEISDMDDEDWDDWDDDDDWDEDDDWDDDDDDEWGDWDEDEDDEDDEDDEEDGGFGDLSKLFG